MKEQQEPIEFRKKKAYQASYIGIKDLFKHYKYPCWDFDLLDKGIVPVPYVAKEKVICDHEYSLEYSEWKDIVDTLVHYLTSYLFSGKPLILPESLGTILIEKFKSKNRKLVDYAIWRQTGEVKFRNFPQTQYYSPAIRWRKRGKEARFKFKSHWKLRFLPKPIKRLAQILEKDYSKINLFPDMAKSVYYQKRKYK